MSRLIRVSTLIRDIYGAALSPQEWPPVMLRALALLRGNAAFLFTRDLSGGRYAFECAIGAEAHVWSGMLARFEQNEPAGTIFQTADATTDATLDFIGTLLERSPAFITGLYVRRRGCTGLADARSRAMLALLAPHVGQALCIGRRLQSDAPALALRMQQVAGRYGLTPAEVRVVQALLDGCTVERGAQLLGIRPATVKTHLQHVFDKTTARRQVDLIKLIAEPGQTAARPPPMRTRSGVASAKFR